MTDSRPVPKRARMYVARKALHEFSEDECTDLAAALTYYSLLALFPAAIALVSLLGVVGQAGSSVQAVLDILKPLVSPQTLSTVKSALTGVSTSSGAGLGVIIGILGALWSASGYVSAYGRAMNRIYEIGEGRPFWKLRPVMLLVTLVAVLLVALVLVMLVVSGALATSIGDKLGLGSQALTVWNIVKWPIIVLVVMVIVALLNWATPNVQQPKFRWLSAGAFVAIVIWVLGSVAFAFFVANFSSYNKTYGSLAGVVVTLLFLWITNLALLFGAEVDSELERARQLGAGIAAEEDLQLAPRDTRGIKKARRKQDKDIAAGRRIRDRADTQGDAVTDEDSSVEESHEQEENAR